MSENPPRPVLPPETVPVDPLDAAVAEINRISGAGGLRTALELGQYLVDTFFDRQVEATSTDRASSASWRALAARDDLVPSPSSLWVAVQILRLHGELSGEVRDALSVSHYRRLVAVRDASARQALAERAVREALTVEALERVLAAENAPVGRGRKPVPLPLKAIRAAGKLLARAASADLDATHTAALLREIDAQLEALGQLRTRVAALA